MKSRVPLIFQHGSAPAPQSSVRLAPVFRGAMSAAGLGASAWLAACGGSSAGPFVEDQRELRTTHTPSGTVAQSPGFTQVECSGAEYPQPFYLNDLEPARSVDYVELRRFDALRESRGEPCRGAADRDACLARLTSLAQEPAMQLGQLVQLIDEYHLRATIGDEVLRVGTPQELLSFLGPIDSVGDALLLTASRGYNLLCGESGGVESQGGIEVLAFTYQGCDGRTRHLLGFDPSGEMAVLDSFVERAPDPYCVVGRRPQGLVWRSRGGRRSLGAFFAGCAELEAASVPAFVRLARELRAHGAPSSLVWRALAAARDEVRHARAVALLAQSFGGRPRWPRLPVGAIRSLEAVAVENAAEGSVRETYGAVVALHQAARAGAPRVRRQYAQIAADETRHAELSWDVARWAERCLGPSARRSVSEARTAAARELRHTLRVSSPTSIDAAAGLPAPPVGVVLMERLAAELWSGDRALA